MARQKKTKDNPELSVSSSKHSYCQPRLAFASDSIELFCALIPLLAASTQVSQRQLLSRWHLRSRTGTVGVETIELHPSEFPGGLFGASRWPSSPHEGLGFHSLCLQRQPFSLRSLCKYSAVILAWNRQSATILIQEHLHSHNYHRFWELHQDSNIFQRYQIRYVSRASRTKHVGSFSFTGSLLLKTLFRMESCFSKINACSKSKQKKKLACKVQEAGFPSSHKFQRFDFRDQKSTHVRLPSCPKHQRHMYGKRSSCDETVESRGCDVSFLWVSGLQTGEKHWNFEALKREKMWKPQFCPNDSLMVN